MCFGLQTSAGCLPFRNEENLSSSKIHDVPRYQAVVCHIVGSGVVDVPGTQDGGVLKRGKRREEEDSREKKKSEEKKTRKEEM